MSIVFVVVSIEEPIRRSVVANRFQILNGLKFVSDQFLLANSGERLCVLVAQWKLFQHLVNRCPSFSALLA